MINRELRSWQVVLVVHVTCYLAFFVGAFMNFNRIWYESQNNFIILLAWTILILLYVAAHYRPIGRANLVASERQAYRDGFADAVRQFSPQAASYECLTLNDDAEVEPIEKRKRCL